MFSQVPMTKLGLVGYLANTICGTSLPIVLANPYPLDIIKSCFEDSNKVMFVYIPENNEMMIFSLYKLFRQVLP
jgi:hypothetical protein